MPAPEQLEVTSPDHEVEHEAHGFESGHGTPIAPIAPRGEVRIARWGIMGRMGPGGSGGAPGPKASQLDAFHYFEQFGERHYGELKDMDGADLTLDTGSPYASWKSGTSKAFVSWLMYQLFEDPTRPFDLLETTLAPRNTWQLIDVGRDADNPDEPNKANDYQPGVTREMQRPIANSSARRWLD
jgi:hypothetical protein